MITNSRAEMGLDWPDFRRVYEAEAFPKLALITRKHFRCVAGDVDRLLAPKTLEEVRDRMDELAAALHRLGNQERTIQTKLARLRGAFVWAENQGLLAEGESTRIATPAACSAWETFRRRHEREVLRTLAFHTRRIYLTIFREIDRIIAPARPEDLTPEKLSLLQAALREQNNAEATIKKKLVSIKAMLNWAESVKIIPEAPSIKMPRRAPGSQMMKGRPITTEEFERMLTAAVEIVGRDRAPSWRHLLRGLFASGLRIAESLELSWDGDQGLCIDLTGRRPLLRIPAEYEKGNQDRLMPIAPEFEELLFETPEQQRTGYVFDPRAKRAYGQRFTPLATIQKISAIGKAAGIIVGKDRRRKPKYASAHDLRRSFGERWASRVMPAVLKELMRHESIETTLKYYVGRNAERTADILWQARAGETAKPAIATAYDECPIGDNQRT